MPQRLRHRTYPWAKASRLAKNMSLNLSPTVRLGNQLADDAAPNQGLHRHAGAAGFRRRIFTLPLKAVTQYPWAFSAIFASKSAWILRMRHKNLPEVDPCRFWLFLYATCR
jgi:hypothetical protein